MNYYLILEKLRCIYFQESGKVWKKCWWRQLTLKDVLCGDAWHVAKIFLAGEMGSGMLRLFISRPHNSLVTSVIGC